VTLGHSKKSKKNTKTKQKEENTKTIKNTKKSKNIRDISFSLFYYLVKAMHRQQRK